MTTEEKRNKKREQLIVYQDEYIVVWKASNTKECILIARDYHICTAKIGGNLYPRYRLRFHSTFFFIKFKSSSTAVNSSGYFLDPFHFIIIDAQKNNVFQWGYTNNKENIKKYTTEKEIVEMFPKIKPLFDNNVVKNDPLKEEELPTLNLQLE